MKIIRVTRRQLRELEGHLRPENRRIIRELTISNIYLQNEGVLCVADDDVQFANFPPDKLISVAALVIEAWTQTEGS